MIETDDTEQARILAHEQMANLYLARVVACRTLRNEGWTLRRIGLALGLSHEWVRQLLMFEAS